LDTSRYTPIARVGRGELPWHGTPAYRSTRLPALLIHSYTSIVHHSYTHSPAYTTHTLLHQHTPLTRSYTSIHHSHAHTPAYTTHTLIHQHTPLIHSYTNIHHSYTHTPAYTTHTLIHQHTPLIHSYISIHNAQGRLAPGRVSVSHPPEFNTDTLLGGAPSDRPAHTTRLGVHRLIQIIAPSSPSQRPPNSAFLSEPAAPDAPRSSCWCS
jgi:hypothetical protein